LKPKNPLSGYLTKSDLAKALGLTCKTLDRWQINGLGPPRVQVGKLVLYRQEMIESWLQEREGEGRRA